MILFGTRGLKSKKDTGHFFCPICENTREYIWIVVRKWFTLYFIPLIPLGMVGGFVECKSCKGTFEEEAIRMNSDDYKKKGEEALAEYQKGIRNIMILIMLADGVIDPGEMEVIQGIYSKIAGNEYDADTLRKDIENVQSEYSTAEEYAKKMNGLINENGKTMVLDAAIMVALADNKLVKEEKKMIYKIGKEFDFSKSDIKKRIKEYQGE